MIPQFHRTPTSVETYNDNENEELKAIRQSLKEALHTVERLRKENAVLKEKLQRKAIREFVPINAPYGN